MSKPEKTTGGKPDDDTNPESLQGGLCLVGKVISRQRREIRTDASKTRFCITLAVLAGTVLYHVDLWSDVPLPASLPVVGEFISEPVAARAFVSKGVAQMRLEFLKSGGSQNF